MKTTTLLAPDSGINIAMALVNMGTAPEVRYVTIVSVWMVCLDSRPPSACRPMVMILHGTAA